MKKVLFITKYPTCIPENLKRKFDGEMNACVRLGYEVWYMEWDGVKFTLCCLNTHERKNVITVKPKNLERYYHTKYFLDLNRACCKILNNEKFDYVYMRYMPMFPSTVNLAKKIKKRQVPFMMEIPSYPVESEEKKDLHIRRRLFFLISQIFRKSVFSNVDLFVLCGKEENGYAYGRPALNIYNGVDVHSVPLRVPNIEQKKVHILLLASMSFWQGYDRMIYALSQYKDKENVILHFVGNDGDGSLARWKLLAEELDLKNQIVFHGALYGSDLDEIITLCDIGVGTLGLYRRNNVPGATLKVREYMSRGLPFVYSGEDVALKSEYEYAFQVSNDDTPLDMQEIVNFANKMKNRMEIPSKMREFALKHMSWEKEFERIFITIDGQEKI